MSDNFVSHIESEPLETLCAEISSISKQQTDWTVNGWPHEQLQRIAQAGVYRWFVSEQHGGLGWDAGDVARGYIRLGSACMTSTFIVTQRVAALKRVATSGNAALVERRLPAMLDGSGPGTVGISHLTTSGRHLTKPLMSAVLDGRGYRVNGIAPWVTGANGAAQLLLGAVLGDGREILFLVDVAAQGVSVEAGFDLVALSASHTGVVKCVDVVVDPEMIVAGPKESVLVNSAGKGGGAGGVQTSALALGLAKSAIEFIASEARKRSDLVPTHDALQDQLNFITGQALALATGQQDRPGELRANANSLVMRATQAAMIAAKGAGFVKGHPVGRWCSEALFFLVWSCPQTVADANLCELTGGGVEG